MKTRHLVFASLLAAAPLLHGCSKPPVEGASLPAAADASTPPAETAMAEARPEEVLKACNLVTAEEMSTILGKPVTAAGEERPSNDETTCAYTFAGSLSPDVTFMLNRGAGEAAMAGVGMMSRREPGIADPYEGIGDQAATVGPQLWIRTGDDLVTLTLLGVDDAPAVAKRILETAQARM
ncbi:MAG: hypothetical protein ABIO38_00715 [Luteimonas sp.]